MGYAGVATFNGLPGVPPEYPALHSLGLIAIGGPLHLNWIFLKGLDISLTEDGSRESLKWKKKSSGFWELPIGTRQLNEVTGIRDLESGKAQVEFSWSWTPNRIGEQLAKAVDESNASEQEFLRKEQQAYEQQLDRNKVDRLQRLQLDLNRQQYVSRVTQLQALWVGGKKLDKSRVFKSIIEFWLYDDGWRPAPKGDQSLREALDVAEKAAG